MAACIPTNKFSRLGQGLLFEMDVRRGIKGCLSRTIISCLEDKIWNRVVAQKGQSLHHRAEPLLHRRGERERDDSVGCQRDILRFFSRSRDLCRYILDELATPAH